MSDNARADKLAYSIAEACQATSLAKSTIYRFISTGALSAKRIGGRTVIPAASLRALIEGSSAPVSEAA